MTPRPPAHQEHFLDVSVRMGRTTIPSSDVTRSQVLIDVRPVAAIKGAVPKLDYRLVVDRSISMNDPFFHGADMTRLEAVRPALAQFVRDLRSSDQAMLTSFNQDHSIDFDRALMDPTNRFGLISMIKSLKAGGSTHLSGAIAAALAPARMQGYATRLVLFTDGNSTSDAHNDHINLVQLADESRMLGIPWNIYGTGSDYNWELLQQLTARIGNGSFCKHILDLPVIEAHLTGELAFHRGVTVDGLTINGICRHGKIVSATRFMPLQMPLPNRKMVDPSEGRPRDYFEDTVFHDGTGSLDCFRGQQILLEIDIPRLSVGEHTLLTLDIRGAVISRGLLRFHQVVPITIEVADTVPAGSAVDPEILRIMRMMAAKKAADEDKYDTAATLYRRAGDSDTADQMDTLHQMSVLGNADRADIWRTGQTCTGVATSMTMTCDALSPKRRRRARSTGSSPSLDSLT
jgi:hypothetical protein